MEELDSGQVELTILPQKTLDALNDRITELEHSLRAVIRAIVDSQVIMADTRKQLDVLIGKRQ